MQAAGTEKISMIVSSMNPACYNFDLLGKICPPIHKQQVSAPRNGIHKYGQRPRLEKSGALGDIIDVVVLHDRVVKLISKCVFYIHRSVLIPTLPTEAPHFSG